MPFPYRPLSFAQQRLWFVDQLSPGKSFYNIPLVLDLEGPLDTSALERALGEIVLRHEPLRTVFPSEDGRPRQEILPARPVTLPVETFPDVPDAERDAALDRRFREESRQPFDLATGPVFRARLLRLEEHRHVLLAAVHHIAFDGWSGGIFLRELSALYAAFSTGRPSPLSALPVRYVDFAGRQRDWLTGETFARQMAYWKDQLRAPRPMLALPTDRPRPPVQTFRGHRDATVLPESLFDALQALSRREGVTLFMTMLAAYGAFLHRLTGQDDLLIGTPIANRTSQDVEPLIGFFANSLALRLDLSGDPTFRALLAQAKRVAVAAYANQDLPFERIVEELNPERSLSHSPILQTLLVLNNTPYSVGDQVSAGTLTIRRRQVATGSSKFDTTLMIRPAENGRRVSLEFSADLFDEASGVRMLRDYCRLLSSLVGCGTETSVARLPLLSDEDRSRVTVDWRGPVRPYDTDQTIVTRFESQTARTPDACALIHGEERLSYRVLNARANALARELRARGLGRDDRVGICLDRTPSLVVAVLAVLKAGAAYVPLDPTYPRDRLSFILNDAQCRLVLTSPTLAPIVDDGGRDTLVIDRPDQFGAVDGATNLESAARGDDLAYVIYTSGSTGRPKGVAIEHRNVGNLVSWALDEFSADELSGMLASTSISFDLSVFELFVPLSVGGSIILVDNLLALPAAPARTCVTFINTVPSVMQELLRMNAVPPGAGVVALAGEALHQPLVERLYELTSIRKVFDLYGPTETTVYATCALRTPGGVATIGRPIANTTALVLDSLQRPVPVGATGELYLGGAGVARGYLGRPDLTSERFVVDPLKDSSIERAYRTGDRVRWRTDGSLEFLGRMDRQVKLRGFRVELGEVESALAACPSIQEAVVLRREDVPDQARLVAYIVEREPGSDEEIHRHLEQRLPHYMIPWTLVRLSELPRLPNGKIDHAAMQASEADWIERERVRPRTATEEAVAGVWREVLHVPDPGVDEHFFRLGGHSLLATQVASRLERLFNVPVEVDTVFREPTIAGQAHLIDLRARVASGAGHGPSIVNPVDAPQADLLDEWAGRPAPYPRDRTVHGLFESLAASAPDAVAVAGVQPVLTYRELNERANRLARHLSARPRAGAAAPIAVCLERSAEAIVVLLAILKSGSAYVPLDPEYPPARLATLIERAGVGLVVTCASVADRLSGTPANLVLIDAERDAIAAEEASDLQLVVDAEALAYVMFTSGSTGQPKGVGVPHRAIARLVHGLADVPPGVPLGPGHVVLHMAPLGFDASTFEIWGPLLAGGRIAVAPLHLIESASLEAFIESQDVSVAWLTSSLFNAIVDDRCQALVRLRWLLIGGEALSASHVARALSALPETRIVNGYGPTEATTFTCIHAISDRDVAGGRSIPIGRPLPNTRIYVLGADRERVPIGEPGELWIGGDGLALGYLNDRELTESRFVRDPFVADPDARMYRSGDRVRFLSDGTLDFLGRLDDQVKIRGFRIEPGEIEAALLLHPRVSGAAVVVVERPGVGRMLVAFFVPASGTLPPDEETLLASDIRAFLKGRLPDYMVPPQLMALGSLPLLASGKIDRRALPALARQGERPRAAAADLPGSHAERVIAGIWRELLVTERVAATDDFFELGGHSLLATQVLSRLRALLGTDIDLRSFFAAPTVAGLAAAVDKAASTDRTTVPIPRTEPERDRPLSFSQQRLWFLQQWFADSGVYNVPTALRLEGPLDVQALERALRQIVERHEALRTLFPLAGGHPVQRVLDRADVALPITDLSTMALEEATRTALALAKEEGGRLFDLGVDPPFRVGLVRLASTTHVLLLTLHHIVADGWSLRVLFNELELLYSAASRGEQPSLPALPVQYPDFAVWQRQHLSGSGLERHMSYWQRQLAPPLATLDLPVDRVRPSEATSKGGRVACVLPLDQWQSLRRLSAAENVTNYMALLAVFQALLHRYSGQDDVCVGSPVANRTRPELELLIGCFVNTLVLRGDLSGDPTFRTVVQRTRGTAIDAQEHQDLPFELLVDTLRVERNTSHAPLFQAMFVYHEGPSAVPRLTGLSVSRLPMAFDYAKFDVSLELHQTAHGLSGSLEYNADLFERRTAERMVGDFKILVAAMLADPDRRVSEVAIAGASASTRRPHLPVARASVARTSSAPKDFQAPTELEGTLQNVWSRILDLPSVGTDDNFFDLGGNSMLAVQLFAELSDRFHVNLRLSTLFREGTVRKQALLLSRHQQAEEPTRSAIVPIQPLGMGPPFFLVHGIGGEVISFQALARRVGTRQPIYGVQANAPGDDRAASSVEDVAARYVREIRAVAPRGPYRVGGYSAGGAIAYEMAQQLQAAGEEVALLAMLDASAPGPSVKRLTPATVWRLVRNATYWPVDDEFFRMKPEHRQARVKAKLRAMRGRAQRRTGRGEVEAGDIRDRLGVWALPASANASLEQYLAMLRVYRPQPYDGVVTLLRARTLRLGYYGAPDLGWSELARRGVSLRVIPGAHDTILREPRVRHLADALTEALEESAG